MAAKDAKVCTYTHHRPAYDSAGNPSVVTTSYTMADYKKAVHDAIEAKAKDYEAKADRKVVRENWKTFDYEFARAGSAPKQHLLRFHHGLGLVHLFSLMKMIFGFRTAMKFIVMRDDDENCHGLDAIIDYTDADIELGAYLRYYAPNDESLNQQLNHYRIVTGGMKQGVWPHFFFDDVKRGLIANPITEAIAPLEHLCEALSRQYPEHASYIRDVAVEKIKSLLARLPTATIGVAAVALDRKRQRTT